MTYLDTESALLPKIESDFFLITPESDLRDLEPN